MALFQIAEPGMSDAPHEHRLTVGIDLGTTNSLVASVRNGVADVLSGSDGGKLLASVVHYLPGGKVEVGNKALESLYSDPKNTVASVKRLLGRSIDEINEKYRNTYSMRSDGRLVFLETTDGLKTPVEISGEILKALKDRAESVLGGDLVGAVITVPAYFDDTQRQATKDAAKLAGLNVLRLLNEPTAAALAYGLDKGAEGVYVIYDLGGGTFDVSILRLSKGVFEVLATGGDSALGGDDYDRLIATHMKNEAGVREPLSQSGERLLRGEARKLKEALTQNGRADYDFGAGGRRYRGELSREELADLSAALTKKTLDILSGVLHDAGLDKKDIEGLVLVGGSTRMPAIRDAVKNYLGFEPYDKIDPDLVVATGAAYQADLLAGNHTGDDWLLLDVTPLSLGLETMGGLVEKIIPRNTAIPVARAQDFTTFRDGQTALAIHVVQGERELVSACRSLAKFELRGIPPLVAGSARIRVTFSVDADGILSVSAREMRSGVQASVTVKPSYGLTDNEIKAMLQDAGASAEVDKEERAAREKILEAQRLIESTTGALREDSDLLSPEELSEMTGALKMLGNAIEHKDLRAVGNYFDLLSKLTEPFAARRMDRAIEKALAGKSIEEI